MQSHYSPFRGKAIFDITYDDLQTLVDESIAEGYWVEYKREPVGAKHIAKSVSSFANTDGGWYIIGVEDEDDVAHDIVGYDPSRCDGVEARVRDAVKSHISPVPVVHVRVLQDAAGTRNVLVAYVPTRQAGPFIHSDGKFYRRNGASSDPEAETDRRALDKMLDRQKELETAFHADFSPLRFSGTDPAILIDVRISPYPLGLLDEPEIFEPEAVDSLRASLRSVRVTTAKDDFVSHVVIGVLAPTLRGLFVSEQVRGDLLSRNWGMEFTSSGSVRLMVPMQRVGNTPRVQASNTDARDALNLIASSSRNNDVALYDVLTATGQLRLGLSAYLQTTAGKVWTEQYLVSWSITDDSSERDQRCVAYADHNVWSDWITTHGILPVCSATSGGVEVVSLSDLRTRLFDQLGRTLGIGRVMAILSNVKDIPS